MNRLWVRLSLAFGLVILVAAAFIILTPVLVRYFSEPNLPPSPEMLLAPGGTVDELVTYYQEHQTWNGVEELLESRPKGRLPFTFRLAIPGPDGKFTRYGTRDTAGIRWWETLPIEIDGEVVGFLEIAPNWAQEHKPGSTPPIPMDRNTFFLKEIARYLWYIAIAGAVLGIGVGVVMSRNLAAPLGRLAEAARAIAGRDLTYRVTPTGSQEMIEVAEAFNDMAAELEKAEQLRRNLMADVAHELRTPLTVIQGNLRAVLDDVYPLEKQEIANLYDQTRLLSRLVGDLHELTLAEAGQLNMNFETLDVARLAQSVAGAFAPVAESRDVALTVEIPAELPAIRGDGERLKQVLQNLLTNALRHTPAGETVTLRVADNAGQVWMSVIDSGEGISPEHVPHVFDRFYRADSSRARAGGGAGLGLAIVRAIVHSHGGTVEASSPGINGLGSTFTVKLPTGGE